MSKSYRIRTTPGQDNGYLKVNVDLNQNYDHLEILSLKISQNESYQNFCSEYGVVAGRVIVNNGFGVPNVKVSIFVPVDDLDLEDPVISELYPYTQPFPSEKNSRGLRYNLLPKTKQSFDHTPVGSFPKKREILDDNTILEVYEKYYKYTTTTNEAGDYILFGVPLGNQILHYDMDVSDIGFLSIRPYEMVSQGFSEELFENSFKFKSSNNIDSLNQIITDNIPIRVEPYWCDSLNFGSPLGINRLDISIDDIQLIPNAIFTGSIISDDEGDFLSKECDVSRRMGLMSELITGGGVIEAIRRTVDGKIETFNFNNNSIDDNGNWSVLVPMNIRKVVTDEFGNLVPSPDGIKGVATEGDYRFRISMDSTTTDKKFTQRAKFLVPNTNNNFNFGPYSSKDLRNSDDFTINRQLSTLNKDTPYEDDLRNQYNYLNEFFPFRWKKVYTVKQYIGRFQKINGDDVRSFIGIKDSYNAEGVNKFPFNRIDARFNVIYAIICIIVTVFGHAIGIINGILNIINGLVTEICNIKIPLGVCIEPECTDTNGKGDGTGCSPDGSPCCACYGDNQWGPILLSCFGLDFRCIFGGLLCATCSNICAPDNTFKCDDSTIKSCGTNNNDCCDSCCGKIPLIPLRCPDEPGLASIVTLIPTPFASDECNDPYVVPFSCINCGGLQTPVIKDWVSCLLEPVAVYLKMLKFDFYNDWVGGSLYFPLIKRLYKLKKEGRRFGQLKRDKFCDYDCRIIESLRPEGVIASILTGGLILFFDIDSIYNFENNFQDEDGYFQWRIFMSGEQSVEFSGCRANIHPNISTEWYGTPDNDLEIDNLDLAVKELILQGKNEDEETCYIKFSNYNDFENLMNSQNINYTKESRFLGTPHSKPNYIEIRDINGNKNWKNVGGHGHHTNFCRNTRLMERSEYFKETLDCNGPPISGNTESLNQNIFGTNDAKITASDVTDNDSGLTSTNEGNCGGTCEPTCGTNGVAPCRNKNGGLITIFGGNDAEFNNYKTDIGHGLISWNDSDIYYTPYIPVGDKAYSEDEYKSNIILPTTIMELGSSVYCDIDDIPFIMDQLEPTTFKVSTEDMTYVVGGDTVDEDTITREVTKYIPKDGTLNLRAYVELSCFSVVCQNTLGSVNSSQIGVDIIDKNDLGIEIGNCFVRFNHDEELRSYFCRRFNGYKGTDLTFHHNIPGSLFSDNKYETYPEIRLKDLTNSNLLYNIPFNDSTTKVASTYNDNDLFIPGDGCGYIEDTKTDYFYGLAPGQTSGFINYPNNTSTINFGQTAQLNGDEDFIDDDINGDVSIKGIKFNRSQTPYYMYFGLIPGKTALHKTVSKFFADKINEVTLQGLGGNDGQVNQNINNTPNINNDTQNQFTIYKTCLGETLINSVTVGGNNNNG
jgi:hypothetical protein